MSYEVSGNNIKMTRGDTVKISVTMKYKQTGEIYDPQPEDTIRFAMKKNSSDKNVIFEKEIPIDTQILSLDPEDTKPFSFGRYCYDIQLTYANGDVDTFITGDIFITNEVA